MPQKPAQRNGQNRQGWTDLLQGLARDEAVLIQGGGPENIGKQHEKGRLTARERIAELIDPGTEFFEAHRRRERSRASATWKAACS